MSVDILIPTYNNAKFLGACLDAALRTAELINANVILSVNHCTDDTETILNNYTHPSLKIVRPKAFLTSMENFYFCLLHSNAKFVITCGSDDILISEGQAALAELAKFNKYGEVIFGFDHIIDSDSVRRRSHEFSPHFRNLDKNRIILNTFSGRNPNLNGTWIKRELFDTYYARYKDKFQDEGFMRVSDLYFWMHVCEQIIFNTNPEESFLYLHAPVINYREYFEKKLQFRSLLIDINTNHGRRQFILDCYDVANGFPCKYSVIAMKGLSNYVACTVRLVYESLEKNERASFIKLLAKKELIKHHNLYYMVGVKAISFEFILPIYSDIRLLLRSTARFLVNCVKAVGK